MGLQSEGKNRIQSESPWPLLLELASSGTPSVAVDCVTCNRPPITIESVHVTARARSPGFPLLAAV